MTWSSTTRRANHLGAGLGYGGHTFWDTETNLCVAAP